MLLLAALIAFNSARINADDRARDHATMFAFGMPLRKALRMNIVESTTVGALAAVGGLLSGWVLTNWLVNGLYAKTYPEFGLIPALLTWTILATLVLGIAAAGLAPMFTIRKLRRMDIPSMLRVIE